MFCLNCGIKEFDYEIKVTTFLYTDFFFKKLERLIIPDALK